MVTWPVVPSDERRQADEAADQPDDGDGDADKAAGSTPGVLDGVVKRVVPGKQDPLCHFKLVLDLQCQLKTNSNDSVVVEYYVTEYSHSL